MRRGIVALVLITACGGGKNGGGSPTSPTPVASSLTGTVTSNAGARIAGALVRITDGPNGGRQANTDTTGTYNLTGLTAANSNVFASAACFNETGKGLFISGPSTLNFTLDPAPPFSVSGVGDNVFDMPTCVARVHVVGRFNGFSSNFIVHVNDRLLVNELLGTFWSQTVYDAVLLTTGGVTSITGSSGVQWTFTEVK